MTNNSKYKILKLIVYAGALFFTACSVLLLYLDDMHANEKIRELVILDWYFSVTMEVTSTWKNGNEKQLV